MSRIPAKTYLALLYALIFVSPLAAQGTGSVAPIKWQRYVTSEKDVSINFPKVPLRIENENSCFERATTNYYGYAGGMVYELTVVKKKTGMTRHCYEKRSFGRAAFNERKKELLAGGQEDGANKVEIGGKPALWLATSSRGTWLIDDLSNDRWFEVGIFSRSDVDLRDDRYFKSFEIDSKEGGSRIGKGSETMVGDEGIVSSAGSSASDKTLSVAKTDGPATAAPLRIIAKPKARYTDSARQNQEQGSVTLRVAFMASGNVGAITVVSGLEYGLTEQAVKAAGKLVFLPALANGRPQTVTKTVQYSFTIY